MTNTFYADVAKYQRVVDASYPYPMLAFRADSGFDTDPNAEANWLYCQHAAGIKVAIGYVVFIPGASAEILSRLKLLFGQTAPAKLVVMVDMESGTGFAGPGNHSAEANTFITALVGWLGNRNRVIGYANKYDWASNWPGRPAWMRCVTAAYSATDPGTFGWQYYGGVANPHPAGYPTSCPPFGSAVDMNVIHLPIDQIVTALGLSPEDEMTPADLAEIKALLAAQAKTIETTIETKIQSALTNYEWDKTGTEPNAAVHLGAQLHALADNVAALVKKEGA